jgi:hypothetical protein
MEELEHQSEFFFPIRSFINECKCLPNLIVFKEALVNTMVGVELLMWFFIGEVIGRGTLVGYDVSRVKPKFPFW